jgi:molecular chaperone GrpE
MSLMATDRENRAPERASSGETATRVSPPAATSTAPHGDQLAEARVTTQSSNEDELGEASGDAGAPVAAGEPEAPTGPVGSAPEPSADGSSPDGAPDDLSARAQKADEYLELAKRTKADFENFRKRAAREAALAQERGVARLAKELLPAIDNLERALAHAPQGGEQDVAAFAGGVEHVHADLLAALQRAGIESYSPVGEPFDPTLHEAIAKQPVEGAAPDTVAEVYQRGYRIGETVLRPARVVVAG